MTTEPFLSFILVKVSDQQVSEGFTVFRLVNELLVCRELKTNCLTTVSLRLFCHAKSNDVQHAELQEKAED